MKLVTKNITKLLLGVLFVFAGLLYSCGYKEAPRDDLFTLQDEPEAILGRSEEERDLADVTEAMIYVHVCGEVLAPGVYEVLPGTRGYELINLAGGFTPEAAEDYLNLAKEALDGDKLQVPAKGEVSYLTLAEGSQEQEQRININTATAAELMSLPGIGEAKAKAIIKYRESYGAFRALEDIMNISGIKEGAYEKIRDFISI